jgi:hypothetical protein
LNWETIIAQPGAQTTTTVNKDGSEDTVVKLPSGVSFHQGRRNGKTWIVGTLKCSLWKMMLAIENSSSAL